MTLRGPLFIVLLQAMSALGQESSLVRNDTAVTTGADASSFHRNTTHFTFDMLGSTGGFDWLRAEAEMDVVGAGEIWHASNQRFEIICELDPNYVEVAHNLNTPGLAVNATNNQNTLMYDTFFTRPGPRFYTDPILDSPGNCTPCDTCAANPPVISTPKRIRGRNTMNEEIPLVWYDTIDAPLNNTVLARLTFQVPEGFGDLVVNPTDTTGRQLFATIRGRIWSTEDAAGAPYAFDIWQTPEPTSATLALFALIAAGGIRRSRVSPEFTYREHGCQRTQPCHRPSR